MTVKKSVNTVKKDIKDECDVVVEAVESCDSVEDAVVGNTINEEQEVEQELEQEVSLPVVSEVIMDEVSKVRNKGVAKIGKVKAEAPNPIYGINDSRYLLNAPSDRGAMFVQFKEVIMTLKSQLNSNPNKIEDIVAHIDFYKQYLVDYAEHNKEYAKQREELRAANAEKAMNAAKDAATAAARAQLQEAEQVVAALKAKIKDSE